MEAAIDRGLAWLVSRQGADGGWEVQALGGRAEYAPALNGLAVLAMVRSRPEAGDYRQPVGRAAGFLVSQQAPDGRFGGDSDGTMYNHGIATVALLEAFHLTGDEALRPPITKALAFIRARQSAVGGWGYREGRSSPPNTSISSWQVQALLLASLAGWPGNEAALRRGLAWMAGTVDGRGFFGYGQRGDVPKGADTLTLMGAYCTMAAQRGHVPVDPAAVARVRSGLEELACRTPADYYGSFFYAAALHEADPAAFAGILCQMQSPLAARQEAGGAQAGAWLADDKWGSVGGRLYSTSLALLALHPACCCDGIQTGG